MARIVFLDFDGVLNSRAYLDRIAGTLTDADYLTQAPILLDGEAVARLDDLVTRTGSCVVVTSTWRIRRTAEELQALLRQRGFHGVVTGVTATGMLDRTRAGEIRRWLEESGRDVDAYVILDDDATVAEFGDRHVLTHEQVGLTEEDCRRALEILERDGE